MLGKRERNKEEEQLIKEIDKTKSNLGEDISKNKPLLLNLEELEDKFNKIYDFETKGLIIRSRVRWLEEGEKNSK